MGEAATMEQASGALKSLARRLPPGSSDP